MSELQEQYNLKPKKRFRGKSLGVQLQVALDHLAALAKVKRKDTESYITEVKAATIRVKTLNWMISRKETKKFEKLEVANAKLRSEVSALKAANEKLSTALAVKPITVSEISEVEKALAKYNASKGGAQ